MKYLLLLLTVISFAACNGNKENSAASAPGAIDGEQLYKVNCAQCHRPVEDFVGPALKNAAQRWKDKKLLYEFVRNSSSVIARDEYAKALFEKYKESPMTPMPHLTDADIDAILKYCDQF